MFQYFDIILFMADQKISQLTEHTTIAGTEELVVATGGATKKLKISTLSVGSQLSLYVFCK